MGVRDHQEQAGRSLEGEASVPQEFVSPLPDGRIYTTTRRVHLGDVGSTARLRLEGLARFLQDVATDDGDDSGLDRYNGVWVVRRLAIAITALPRFHDRVELTTFCSGTGPCWAERRTTMTAGDKMLAEAAAVWVYIDEVGGRPKPLEADFFAIYGGAARNRRVSSRLSHRRAPGNAASRPWPLRDSDFDMLDHVNNARYWEAVEDELASRMPGRLVVGAEVEFRGAVERQEVLELVSEVRVGEDRSEQLAVWLISDSEVRMSALVTARARA
jgi:acyl-ACP thioesterase